MALTNGEGTQTGPLSACSACGRHEARTQLGAYTLHYGATEPDPPRTLEDGTIRRYDNSHEDTKGHELHVAPDSEPESIKFPGMLTLWDRFWDEIPKSEIDVS